MNYKDLEDKAAKKFYVEATKKIVKTLTKSLDTVSKFVEKPKVSVDNFPEQKEEIKVTNFPDPVTEIEVKNFPEPVKEVDVKNFPEPVREVTVKNMPKPVTEVTVKNPVESVVVKNMPQPELGIKEKVKQTTEAIIGLPKAIQEVLRQTTQGVNVENQVDVQLIDPETGKPYKAGGGGVSMGGPSKITIDNPTDGFGAVKTAQKTPIIELKSNYGISALRDITSSTNTATITNDKTEYNLSTGTTAGSTAILDSAERGRYVAGQSGEAGIGVRINETMAGTAEAKWGYYDDDNGFGFGQDVNGIFIFIRRGGTTTKTYQSSWNRETLPNLSLAEGHIYQIMYSWYGYGTINYQVVVTRNKKQEVVTVHTITPSGQASVLDPNLPIRAEVDNGDQTTDLDMFVGGRQYAIYTQFTPNRRIGGQYRLSQGSIGETFLPTVSFKKKEAFKSVSVKVHGVDIITDADLIYQLRVNANLTGASYGTPSDTSASETACEVDTSATAVSGGELIWEGIFPTGAGNARGAEDISSLNFDVPSTHAVTLCVRRVSGTNGTVSSVLRFREEW